MNIGICFNGIANCFSKNNTCRTYEKSIFYINQKWIQIKKMNFT